jgi:alpha-beta hydrolase superfamily lysophospholipase
MLKKYRDIVYRQWNIRKPKAVFVLVHGMGAHSGRYQYFADYFTKKGFSGYAMDLPGYGELMGGHKGHVDNIKIYHEHIKQLKEVAAKENPGKPLFLLGESMGGLLVASHAINYDNGYNGVIAIVPAFNDVFNFTAADRVGILIKSIMDPKYPVEMPFKDVDLTTDKKILAKIGKDKLEHKFASAGLLRQLLIEQVVNIDAKIGRLKIPIFMMLSGRDRLVDTKFDELLYKRIRSDKTLKVYQGSLHALTIEKNRMEIYKDIIEWAIKHI